MSLRYHCTVLSVGDAIPHVPVSFFSRAAVFLDLRRLGEEVEVELVVLEDVVPLRGLAFALLRLVFGGGLGNKSDESLSSKISRWGFRSSIAMASRSACSPCGAKEQTSICGLMFSGERLVGEGEEDCFEDCLTFCFGASVVGGRFGARPRRFGAAIMTVGDFEVAAEAGGWEE